MEAHKVKWDNPYSYCFLVLLLYISSLKIFYRKHKEYLCFNFLNKKSKRFCMNLKISNTNWMPINLSGLTTRNS